jgi:hypothetical protein
VQHLQGALKEPDVTGVPVLCRDLRRYALDLLAGRVGIQKKEPPVNSKAA